MLLLNIPITAAAGPLTSAPFHTRGIAPPSGITLQANFHYGSGGTAVDCDVQTSIDGVNLSMSPISTSRPPAPACCSICRR